MSDTEAKYAIRLSFETIQLPPFRDILVLGKGAEHGRSGLARALQLLAPDHFETIDIQEGNVEAVYINRQVLKKISQEKMILALSKKVFPFVSEGELLKVDVKIDVSANTVEYEA
ncbi:hypothetical protein GCM10023093_05190 [Nemorincola caseinilytica]|uniref:Uncharacterized protein n=1 Tax=Nemorincola caseinilytica TaxID=2054315 RepID=A0ABP8N743_9BACT